MSQFNRRQWIKTTFFGGIVGLAVSQLPGSMRSLAQTTATTTELSQSVANAAATFLSGLQDAQRKRATYKFDDTERMRWHWTTPAGFPRNGLPLKDMDDSQKKAALALLQASTSAYGYQKALDIMSLQRDLGSDPQLYYVTVFGNPGSDTPWGWRWEGHHLSRQFTIVGDQIAITPYFLGAWPSETDKKLRAMPREEDAARELIMSLQGQSKATAIFRANTLTEHVTQNLPKVVPLEPVGVAYNALTADQQKLVVEIIQTYLKVQPDALADASWKRIEDAGLDTVQFGWTGPLEARRPHYYRLQGKTFLLEFDCSRNGGTHIHSVWRDFERDFGFYLL